MLDIHQNHFDLFGLPADFALDTAQLDRSYRKLQAEVHPDRFASADAAQQLRAMQLATHVNDAYRTLKTPVSRARYLLHLNGIDTREETNTAMPAEFLMRQMEWREAIEEARHAGDITALDRLLRELGHEAAALEQSLHVMLDQQRDFVQAAETVRKLRFLDKVRGEIEQAVEALEN